MSGGTEPLEDSLNEICYEAVKHTDDAVYITNANGRIEYVNPAFEEITGYEKEEVLGKTPRILNSGEHDDSFYHRLWETITSGEQWETEIIDETKCGDRIVLDQTISPITNSEGEVERFVAIARDVTERKEREEELRRKTRALDNAPVGISISDPSQEDNPLIYVNEAFTEITGYDKDEAVGRNCRYLQGRGTDPGAVAELRDAVDEVNPVDVTLRNYRRDGTPFWNQLSIAPVKDEDGTLESFVGFQMDITERKEREKRLRTHELVVQTMHEAAFLVDDDKRIQFANDAALDFADVTPEAIRGQPIQPVTEKMAAPDEDPQRFLDALDAVLDDVEPDVGKWVHESNGTETLSLEFDLYLESIGEVYAEQRFVPVELYDGERGVAVVSRDITARKAKEEEIQTHLEQAQEIGNVGSWHIDLDKNSLHWSDQCYRIFGMQPGQPMTYDRFLESVHPADRRKVNEAWTAALDGEPYEIEHRIVVDDEIKWVQETAEVTFDENGEPAEGIGVVRDITEQRKREREISEQKRRYESLFNSISGAIVVTDLDGCIRTCNPGFIDLFGYDIDDVEGNHISMITDTDADVEPLFETRDEFQESPILNYRKKSGQVFPGESRTSPLRAHDNDIQGHVIHINDVSDAQKNREQLQVIGRVFRHNIKNTMNIIMAQAELIRDQGSNAVMPQVEKILETSRKFVEMAENQQRITEILTGNAETVKVDLVPIINETVSDLQSRYPDATLQTDLVTGCPVSITGEIGEAIRELVQNAIIHSDQEHPRVEIHLRCTGGITELTIRDDGPGIPEQEWNVLTPEGEIEPLSHGTGLGLWFVDQVVSQSNGTMTFDTNDSGGTTITVRLPSSSNIR